MNFDSYAIITWPGYFFQTALCIRSIIKHLPSRPIHIIIDTNHRNGHPINDPWPNFQSNLKKYIQQQNFRLPNIVWHTMSDVPAIDQCHVGTWRQQLVKLYLDQYLPGESWLVVDADIIFDQSLDFDFIPVGAIDEQYAQTDSTSLGNRLYVKYMLGSNHEKISVGHDVAECSVVPFRQLTRSLLSQIRTHVENLHQVDFIQLHLDLIQQGKLVGYDPECKSMVMSEFALIEIYRLYFSDHPMPIGRVGQHHTYTLYCDGTYRYRHSSLRDWNLGREWLHAQGLQISDDQWQMSELFIKNMPLLRR